MAGTPTMQVTKAIVRNLTLFLLRPQPVRSRQSEGIRRSAYVSPERNRRRYVQSEITPSARTERPGYAEDAEEASSRYTPATRRSRPINALVAIASPLPRRTRRAARPRGAPARCPPNAPNAPKLASAQVAI